MMSSSLFPRRTLHSPSNRFGYLMDLYAENFAKFERLFLPHQHYEGLWCSNIGDGLPLHLHVLEQHRYTTLYRLTYDLLDPISGEPDPSAHLRLYHDARMIEATHCYVGKRWQDTLGLNPCAEVLITHRLRMNVFLGKWLNFLFETGHTPFTLRSPSNHIFLDFNEKTA